MNKFYKSQLSNGLLILGEYNPNLKSGAVGFFVKTGARDERAGEFGVSHFLEHMMFKGTSNRGALDITYGLGAIGAQSNAYTSEEHTVFYVSSLTEYLPSAQEILTDMLRPALDQHEFDTEKKVILEEIALYQDRPQHFFLEKATADFFGTHPVGNSVLGSTESVSNISRATMQSYFDRRYTTNNIVLAVSGNFDWDKVIADAARDTLNWPSAVVTRVEPEFQYQPIKKVYHRPNLTQGHILLMAPGPSAKDPLRHALALLSIIIGDDSGSKFYWQLLSKGLVDGAGFDLDYKDGLGCFYAYANTELANIDRVHDTILEILASATDFTDADLSRAKAKLKSRLVMSGESAMGRMMAVGNDWLYEQRYEPIDAALAKINAISREDIMKATEVFPLTHFSEFELLKGP